MGNCADKGRAKRDPDAINGRPSQVYRQSAEGNMSGMQRNLHDSRYPPSDGGGGGGARFINGSQFANIGGHHLHPMTTSMSQHLQPQHQAVQQQQQQQQATNGKPNGSSSLTVGGGSHKISRKRQIVIALYNYQGSEHGDMSFVKGDLMEIVDDSDADWWLARHLSRENCIGHIPRNYVAFQSSIESQEWYFGSITRYQAEDLLLAPGNKRGTFLIRLSASQQNAGGYALSIHDRPDNVDLCGSDPQGPGRGGQQQHHVKHYKIKPLDNNRGFYITTRHTFATLASLVEGYSSPTAKGLCCTLTMPCPKTGYPRDTKNNALEYATRDQYEISRDQIQLINKLGAGNFGEVWKGSWQGRIDVAVKTLKPNTMSQEAFLQEAEIMKRFSHPHLVSMYAVCTEQEPFFIITEYMSRGALLDNLRAASNSMADQSPSSLASRLTFDNLISISCQVALGMAHLERKALIHRDLAARNVLLGDNLMAKVADFGLARVIVNDNEYSAQHGARFPVKWTAPEAIAFGKFSVKSDVWSYGVLLMETFTFGQLPYPGMNNREVIEQVERGYRMPQPTQICYPESRHKSREISQAQTNVYKIMLECWNRDPVKRPTFEFLAHLFEDFNVATQGQYVE